jgi:lipopolysaccharide/colanic/teichoic acid biosynthesis glycosyltransferase
LWQVSGRSDLDLLSMVRIDDEYVLSWLIGSDFRILALTPKAVLTTRGAF